MELICVICIENITDFKDKKTLPCEHIFHKKCINEYMSNICPICRKENNIINKNIIVNNNSNTIESFKKIQLQNYNLKLMLQKFFNVAQILEFLSFLDNTAIISGSFILSIILNENYNNNSIDIYIDNVYSYIKFLKFLVKSQYILNKVVRYNEGENNTINCIDTFINSENGELSINIIFCKNNLYIIRHYMDFDILKNFYNGTDYYIYDLTKLMYKIDYIYKIKITKNIESQIIKLKSRGFNITVLE
jgi:hypothetical protein